MCVYVSVPCVCVCVCVSVWHVWCVCVCLWLVCVCVCMSVCVCVCVCVASFPGLSPQFLSITLRKTGSERLGMRLAYVCVCFCMCICIRVCSKPQVEGTPPGTMLADPDHDDDHDIDSDLSDVESTQDDTEVEEEGEEEGEETGETSSAGSSAEEEEEEAEEEVHTLGVACQKVMWFLREFPVNWSSDYHYGPLKWLLTCNSLSTGAQTIIMVLSSGFLHVIPCQLELRLSLWSSQVASYM